LTVRGVGYLAEAREWAFDYDLEDEFIEVRRQNPMPYSFDSDGCSVPIPLNWITAYDVRFEDACKRHDFGFQNLGRRLHISQTPVTQDDVNDQFMQDMKHICLNNPQWDLGHCYDAAEVFKARVEQFANNGFWGHEEWTWEPVPDNPEGGSN
jgi:hypothetical protein